MLSRREIMLLTAAGLLHPRMGLMAANRRVEEMPDVQEANSEFAVDAYRQLVKENRNDNVFLSPYSISIALAMTLEGARGRTAEQMRDTLGLSGEWSDQGIHSAFGELSSRLRRPNDHYRLDIANALWAEQSFECRSSFLTQLKHHYGAGLSPLDFIGQPESSRQEINSWVEQQTNGKIKDLLPSGSIDQLTRLVLTNAIYFKGSWSQPFQESLTEEASFRTLDGRDVATPMMRIPEHWLPYGEVADMGLKIAELPYAGDQLSMLILLPQAKNGLAQLEKQLTPSSLTAWTSKLRPMAVNLELPRFKIETKFQLKSTLSALGMPLAFSRNADFTGMTEGPEARRLYLSDVFHKAYVQVNEEGTEAAAATGAVIKIRSLPIVRDFRCDHPFLFLIRDRGTGSLLFVGRLTDPSA